MDEVQVIEDLGNMWKVSYRGTTYIVDRRASGRMFSDVYLVTDHSGSPVQARVFANSIEQAIVRCRAQLEPILVARYNKLVAQ